MEHTLRKFNQDVIPSSRGGQSRKQYNLTLTFNPSIFSIKESWDNKILVDIMDYINKYSSFYFLIKESMKNHYCHYHGIVYLKEEDKIKLYSTLTKKFGKCSLKRNVKDYASFRQSIGLPVNEDDSNNYLRYCLKDYEENCIKIKDRKILTVIDNLNQANLAYTRIENTFQ